MERELVKITRSGECKNSPKNGFVEEFAIDLLSGADLTDRLAGGVTCAVPQFKNLKAIHVHHAISHGKVGAANGTLTTPTGDMEFSLILEFVNTKASQVASCKFYTLQSTASPLRHT